MILTLCGTAEVLNIIRFVKIFITIIKIVVPILLIVSATITYLKGVTTGELQKSNKSLLNQVLAGVIIFLIPTIISVVLNTVWTDSEINQCLVNATGENIAQAKIDRAYKLLAKLEEDFSVDNYNAALSAAKKIKDLATREELIKKIQSYKKYVDISREISKLAQNYTRKQYRKLYETVEGIIIDNIREKFMERLEAIGPKPLNVKAGGQEPVWLYEDKMVYTVYMPEFATEDMPVIMYLHGDNYAPTEELYEYARQVYGEEFPFIIIGPDSFDSEEWKKVYWSKLDVLKGMLDTVCSKYSCDEDRISVVGHSRGAIITWYMVNRYPDYFYSAVPVSCTPMEARATNFKHTKVWAFAGNKGDQYNGNDELNYNRSMSSFVNSIKSNGGNAKFTEFDGASHSDTLYLAFTKEKTFEWMIDDE